MENQEIKTEEEKCMWCGHTHHKHGGDKSEPVKYIPCLRQQKRFTAGPLISMTATQFCLRCKKPKGDEIEVELPKDEKQKRKALIDLEDTIGVIMPEKEGKVIVFRYEKTYCNCGRPTLYTEELLVKADEYLSFKMPWTGEDGIREVVHTIEGLALYIGISRETIYAWMKDADKQQFSDIVKNVLIKQAKGLVAGGLSEAFSGSITKVMMTKHGYRDAVENFNRDVPVDPEAKKKSDEAIAGFLETK